MNLNGFTQKTKPTHCPFKNMKYICNKMSNFLTHVVIYNFTNKFIPNNKYGLHNYLIKQTCAKEGSLFSYIIINEIVLFLLFQFVYSYDNYARIFV